MRNLASFRELLLRKTDDGNLRYLIKTAADEVIKNCVFESLEKMANNRNAGSHANAAIRDFGTEMDPELEPAMIREALGHHASRYKAALENGNQSMANKHAQHFFNILNLIHKAQPHSNGKLQADLIPSQPWERNHPSKSETFAERIARDPAYAAKNNPVAKGNKKPHQYVNDLEGYEFKPTGNDWSFLQSTPHPSLANETTKTGHTGAYPMEHIKINGKFIPIDPVSNIHDGNFHHPFDKHPILSHYAESSKSRSPDRDLQYIKERNAYMDSDHIGNHLEHQEKLHATGELEQRGSRKGDPVHALQSTAAQSHPAMVPGKTIRRAQGTPTSPTGDIDMSKLSPAARALLEKK